MSARRVDRILIADDDAVIRQLLQVNLRLAGFQTEAVASGAAAVESALVDPPSAVVLDLSMPGMDGWEVCRRLRAEPDLAGLPILILSARHWEDQRDLGLEHGVTGFVTKPFDPADVVAAVRSALTAEVGS